MKGIVYVVSLVFLLIIAPLGAIELLDRLDWISSETTWLAAVLGFGAALVVANYGKNYN